ncbi:MauE/DoxX family redox-associated membrane protein [Anditalea andensis]|uniref:Methylamine utilisation protein MauE domain-containing protein n=1 Tax=Anditalea andensis TaxID=1048983 RepID=A0A074LG23_9BACT|nr:MauE/DoxX family redox-associated membrane protein [Anditalea andensis]KEO72742.1 hypothetical protein EL17_18610 [Anditalea andensis]
MKIKGFITEICALLLALLFAYTAISKWKDWEGSRHALYNLIFPLWMAKILFWILPVAEISLTVILLVPGWRKKGFC